MKIEKREEIEERGKKHIEALAKKIVDEMPDLTDEECAVLNTKESIKRIIPIENIPLEFRGRVISLVQDIIGKETYDVEEIGSAERGMIEIALFYKKNNGIITAKDDIDAT